MKRFAPVLLLLMLVAMLAACGETDSTNSAAKAKKEIDNRAQDFQPYVPRNGVELSNYNRAQELYDSPDTIIWCSTTWGNASAPIVTVPIAGKLTSSSTTFFRPEELVDHGNYSWSIVSARSVDGLFHPNPPQYRYAFTPGGQYVDFFNMPTFCTTQLTSFQRQSTNVSVTVDAAMASAQRQAEAALRRGDAAGAQRALAGALNGG